MIIMSAGKDYILNNYKTERVLQRTEYSCTELVLQDGLPYVRKTINAVGLPYGELKKLANPCLPHIFYAVEDEGKTYVIEEYVCGRTLKECLEQNISFSAAQQVNIACQLCGVLELLHGQKILHRDIKPSNIIVMHDLQQVKLIDFGIGRNFSSQGDTEAQDTCIMGTPGYAPPEQYGFTATDQRSDIYALGKTMLELRTAATESWFVAVLEKCIEFDPDKRYQSAGELKAALLRVRKSGFNKPLVWGALMIAVFMLGFFSAKLFTQTQVLAEKGQQVPAAAQKPKDAQDGQAGTALTPQQAKQVEENARNLALLGTVKMQQKGSEWFFDKKTLQLIDEKEPLYTFKGINNKGPVVTIENFSDFPGVNPVLKLDLYVFGIKSEDFVYKTDAGHIEKVSFLRKDKRGIARQVIIKLEGTIEPHSQYTFSALQNVKEFYVSSKTDSGTILGVVNCKHMLPRSVGYTFDLK